MTAAIHQPYLFPYLGYFQLIHAADVFVLADEFAYMKKGWINRNRILASGAPLLITLPVEKVSQNRSIAKHCFNACKDKFLGSIKHNYSSSPFYHDIFPLISDIVNYGDRGVGKLIHYSLQRLNQYIGIDTPLLLLSSMTPVSGNDKGERLCNICHALGAERYINAEGGQALYSKEEFAQNGIELSFLKSIPVPYPQLKTKNFIPNLSIIDLLMNCPPEQIHDMLDSYTLI